MRQQKTKIEYSEEWAQKHPLNHYENPYSNDDLVSKWDDGEPLPWYLTVRGLLIKWLNTYIFRS